MCFKIQSGGGGFGPADHPTNVSTTVRFRFILDPSRYTALQAGDYTLPLD
ncbi:hypothetical protein AALA82_10705 [Oscillospiraceae bacterium 50-16]|nr:hypothetical protein [Lawsonibacter sp.]